MAVPDSTLRSGPLDPAELDDLDFSARRVDRWLWSLSALGIGLRLLVYLVRPPIWTDEAKLAVSLIDRDFGGLLDPLAYGQIAPVAFMWLQKGATISLGYSEYSLRLLPLAAAIASVLLMRHLARQLLTGAPAIFAMAWFAVSYYPVRHAAELKPYATDLLASLVLTVLAIGWLTDGRSRWLWMLAAAAPVAVALSYPAIFVAAGVLAALAIPVWRRWHGPTGGAWAVAVFVTGLAFLLNYFLVGVAHREARLSTRAVWEGGFPLLDDPLAALGWLFTAHTGRTFGYPLGGENGGSLLTFALFAIGALVLVKAGRHRVLAALLLPFLAGLGAAVLQRYPYGGSGRVSQYLVPAICLLAGLGAARLTSLARSAVRRRRIQLGVLAGLLAFGALLAGAALVRPYRDQPDMVARGFACWFWEDKSRDGVLVDAWDDLELEFARPSSVWIPGGAGYRVNRRIYFERQSLDLEVEMEHVSRDHPLRVVFLESAIEGHRDAFESWLREMAASYELVGEEEHSLGGFAEQHGAEERVRLYTFTPTDGGE